MTDSLFDISDRLALVTGSSRGLGARMALGLAERSARVILHGRDEARLAEQTEAMRAAGAAPAGSITFDVTDANAVADGIRRLTDTHGVPNILVNNAGLQRRAPFAEFDPSDWDAVIASNLSSAFYVSHALAAAMIERGSGKIVNIGSVQSKLARQTIAPYGASKGGVALLTQGMAADLASHGIQVNCLSPGYFQTDMNTALWQDDDFNAWIEKRTPAARWGQLDELIGTLVYLCSNASNFVCGQNILVDGGMTSVV